VLAVFILLADIGFRFALRRGWNILPRSSFPEIANLEDAQQRVLLLGDSVMSWFAADDNDRTNLARAISSLSPAPVADKSSGGYGIEIASAQIQGLRLLNIRPRAVVVEVNLRHYSPAWELSPRLQKPLITKAFESGWLLPVRAAAVFKCRFGVLSDRAYLATRLKVAGRDLGPLAEYDRLPLWSSPGRIPPAELGHRTSLARYASDIEDGSSLSRLRTAVQVVKMARIPAVFFLTPINIDYLRARLAPAEMACVEKNLTLLRQTIAQAGIFWVDLSHSLPSEEFDHPPLVPNEHLRARGRKFVADRVGKLLIEALQ
jgi:hypothetical protein